MPGLVLVVPFLAVVTATLPFLSLPVTLPVTLPCGTTPGLGALPAPCAFLGAFLGTPA